MQQATSADSHAPMRCSAEPGTSGPGRRVRAARRPGQTMVEFALTSIVVVVMLFALLQISIIVVQQYGASQVARQTARWLAVRMDTIDSDVVTQARTYATDLPGLGT